SILPFRTLLQAFFTLFGQLSQQTGFGAGSLQYMHWLTPSVKLVLHLEFHWHGVLLVSASPNVAAISAWVRVVPWGRLPDPSATSPTRAKAAMAPQNQRATRRLCCSALMVCTPWGSPRPGPSGCEHHSSFGGLTGLPASLPTDPASEAWG